MKRCDKEKKNAAKNFNSETAGANGICSSISVYTLSELLCFLENQV